MEVECVSHSGRERGREKGRERGREEYYGRRGVLYIVYTNGIVVVTPKLSEDFLT